MARIRSIKPEFWADEKMAQELTRDERLFYVGLWNVADDEGRFIAHPRKLLGEVFPYDRDIHESFIEDSLRTLVGTRRVLLYVHEGAQYGTLLNFLEHQRINRPTPSKLPAPPALSTSHGGLTEGSPLEQGAGSREEEVEQGAGSSHTPRARDAAPKPGPTPKPEPPATPPDSEPEPDPLTTWLGPLDVTDPPFDDPQTRRTLWNQYGPPGMRAKAWELPDGSHAPAADRPRIFALAASGYAAEGHNKLIASEFAGMVRTTARDECRKPSQAPNGGPPVDTEAEARHVEAVHRIAERKRMAEAQHDEEADAYRAKLQRARAWLEDQPEEVQARAALKTRAKLKARGLTLTDCPQFVADTVLLEVVGDLKDQPGTKESAA